MKTAQDYLADHDLDAAFFGAERILRGHVFWSPPPAGVEGYLDVQSPQTWFQGLAADPSVEAFSPMLTAAALFRLGKLSVAANLIGCDPEQQARVTTVADYMIAGRFADIASAAIAYSGR